MALTACALPSQPPSYMMDRLLENVQRRPLQSPLQQHESSASLPPTFFAAKSEQGRRTYQEDAHVQVPCLLGQEAANPHRHETGDFLLAAVFDGHGGPAVAQHCQATLPAILRNHLLAAGVQHQPAGSAAQQSAIEAALIQGFSDCDQAVPEDMASEGGSTALLALVGHHMLHIAHCGDSRAIVVRAGGEVVALTDDHKPERPDEMERIKAAGGHVFWNGGHRVMGVLSMSRAIGDMYLKRFGVIATPEVKSIPHTSQDLFLLLASDGLWGVMSNEQAGRVARTSIARALARGADRSAALRVAAQVLVKAALAAGSNDNVTVVLVEGKALPALETALHAAKARAIYGRSRSAPSATSAAAALLHSQQQQQAGPQQPASPVVAGAGQELRGTRTGGPTPNNAAHLLLVDGIDSGMDLDAPLPASSSAGGDACMSSDEMLPRWVAVEEVEHGSTEELMVRLASGDWSAQVQEGALQPQLQESSTGTGLQEGVATVAAPLAAHELQHHQQLHQQQQQQQAQLVPQAPQHQLGGCPLQGPPTPGTLMSYHNGSARPATMDPATGLASPGSYHPAPLARPQPLQVLTPDPSYSQAQPDSVPHSTATAAGGAGSPSILSPGAQMADLLHMPSLRSVSVPHARFDDESAGTPVAGPGAGSWPCTPSNVAATQPLTWPPSQGTSQGGDTASTPGSDQHYMVPTCCITPVPTLSAPQAHIPAGVFEKGGAAVRPAFMLDPATERLIVAVPQAE